MITLNGNCLITIEGCLMIISSNSIIEEVIYTDSSIFSVDDMEVSTDNG